MVTGPDLPTGEVVLRTFAMPQDTNANGDIFGGWLVSQMDLGGAIFAKQICKKRVATVAIDRMVFLHPVTVGDTVSCYATLLKVGTTSMTIKIDVWVMSTDPHSQTKVTEGDFVYVALDNEGHPAPVYDTPTTSTST